MTAATRTLIRHRKSSSRDAASLAADFLCFLTGLASCFVFHLVGDLPGSELVLIPFIPILFALHPERVSQKSLRPVFLLMGLWLLGQVISDTYRHTEITDWLRGDARIVFFFLDTIGLASLLARNERRKGLFIFAYAVGTILQVKIQPTPYMQVAPWKFGYSYGVTLLATLASCYFYARRRYRSASVILLGMAALHLIMNFRSPMLILLITVFILFPILPERIGRHRILPQQGSLARAFMLVVLVLTAGGLAGIALSRIAGAGFLGEQAQLKQQAQSSGKFGVLIGGRSEILVSARAVLDSPILGHGSYAKDMRYVEMLNDLRITYGYSDEEAEVDDADESALIPTHSHLMGAWVEAGILGAVVWCYILLLTMKSILKITLHPPALAPLYSFMLIGTVWSVLFSPFGLTGRILLAFLLVVMSDLSQGSSPSVLRRARQSVRVFRVDARRGWVRI
ncbi:hypothetical protein [Acidobacterium sp. S8]|uniref:hypothetical protein n=1 Tax=Acidobacterium sp. S8 TaxID=1641854 RepID=UPI00131CE3C9|nr:hypothetical protein [Acidobacterium sp. S8]